MSIEQPRTPAGSPTGGQYAPTDRPEAEVDLGDQPVAFETRAEASRYVSEALGEYVGDHDVAAITDELFDYQVDTDEAGRTLQRSARVEMTAGTDAFWETAAKHAL